MEDIIEKAQFCLNCKVKPCKKGCPMENDIPSFIQCIKKEEYEKAYKILSRTTVLESICGRICPHMSQCMGSCVRGIKSSPVSIGELEAFIGDLALKDKFGMESLEKSCSGKKVAVVGSGPAGLTCAAFLARKGASVTIYEKHSKLGGLLRYGIPDFRLDKDLLDNVIETILSLGIEVKYNKELGKNLLLENLEKDFDAIFLGIGANIPMKMQIDGEDLKGVFGGNSLLETQKHPNYIEKTVAIIGGRKCCNGCGKNCKENGSKKSNSYL